MSLPTAEAHGAGPLPWEDAGRLRRLFDLTDCLPVVLGRDLQAVAWHPRWSEVLGHSTDELAHLGFAALVHPDDRVLLDEELALLAAAESDHCAKFDLRLRHRDGAYRWLTFRACRTHDDRDGAGTIDAVAMDITARKTQERRDADMLRTLEMAEEMSHVGWWALDPQTGRVRWSRELYRIMGRDPATYTPTLESALASYHPDDRPIVEASRMRAMGGETFRFEGRIIRASTNEVRSVVSYGRAETDGETGAVRIFGIFQDVTDLRKAEQEAVRGREAALEASRVKSQFLANMSHEIRTPMNGVIGSAQLLQQTGLSSEQREYVDAISGAGGVLLTLINDVLDLSKIEAGKLELERAAFSLQKVVDETIASFQVLAARKRIALGATFADDVPLRHIGDAVRVRQIFTNLVGNALKFTNAGSIAVAVRRHGDGSVYATVRDSGIGIPPERRAALFEPFVQADGSTTRRFGGTGLGLAITRELVHRMGGSIWFDSEVGEGTTFHFTIALTEASGLWEETTPTAVTVAPAAPIPLDILLAEDNPVNAMVARRMLEREGHKVTLAVNGQAAVEAATHHQFDVVLMDVQMPVLDGFEATRILRATQGPDEARLPIVALTANAMKGDRDRCILAGMDGYLTKPLDRTVLLQTVAQLGRRGDGTFDRATFLTRVGGDLDLACLVAKTFAESKDRLMSQLTAADAANDVVAVHRAAHALRGALGTVGATKALCVAQRLERMTEADSALERSSLVSELVRLVGELGAELTSWRLAAGANADRTKAAG